MEVVKIFVFLVGTENMSLFFPPMLFFLTKSSMPISASYVFATVALLTTMMCDAYPTSMPYLKNEKLSALWNIEACATSSTYGEGESFFMSNVSSRVVPTLVVVLQPNRRLATMSDLELLEEMRKMVEATNSGKLEEAMTSTVHLPDAEARRHLAALRVLSEPEPFSKIAATTALFGTHAASGDLCSLSWDTLRCSNVPLGLLLKSLPPSIPLCTMRATKPASRVDGYSAVMSVLSSDELIAELGLSEHVSFIAGLSPYDYQRDHPHRRPRGKQEKAAKEEAAPMPLKENGIVYPQLWPDILSSAPVVVSLAPAGTSPSGAVNLAVSLAVNCLDLTNSTSHYPLLCPSEAMQPILFNVSVTSSLTGLSTFFSFSPSFDTCSNDTDLPDIGDLNAVQICTGVMPYVPITLDRIHIEAQTIFADPLNRKNVTVSPWQKMMTYFDGDFGTEATLIYPQPTTLQDVSALYGFPFPFTAPANASLTIGILEFHSTSQTRGYGGSLVSDVTRYIDAYNPSVSWNSNNLVLLNTAKTEQEETTLDISLVCGLLPDVVVTVENLLYGPDTGFSGVLLSWAQRLVAGTALPDEVHTVYSISWGQDEDDFFPMSTMNHYLRLLSIAGVTVVASSGDRGGSPYDSYDTAAVEFPASSPYVIAVGATALLKSDWMKNSEIVCSAADGNMITSGGGYSNLPYVLPPQQRFLPPNQNVSRGVPDVAAIGANFPIFINGTVQTFYGTSASAPIIASMMMMLNIDRGAHGQPPLSLVHYFLYNNSERFTDVVEGNNCAGETSFSSSYFVLSYASPPNCFAAGPGWDAVTGLGTPLFPALRDAATHYAPPLLPPEGDNGSNVPSSNTIFLVAGGATVGAGLVATIVYVFLRHQRRKRDLRMQFAQATLLN